MTIAEEIIDGMKFSFDKDGHIVIEKTPQKSPFWCY
jgi:hypothetical protein